MRLDHLLSKEEEVKKVVFLFSYQNGRKSQERIMKKNSGGDALGGHTRSHPEHDG